MNNIIVSIFVTVIITISATACSFPCNSSISKEYATIFSPAIAKQLNVASIEVLQMFKVDSWSVIYVDTHESDEAFLFYKGDPLTSRYVMLWSGVATRSEEQQIKDWAIKNVPGIPEKLAGCFAWYASKGRNQ